MGEIALKVEGLTKEYRLGTIGYGTMREDLQTWWARMRGKDDPNSLVTARHHRESEKKHFLALDDINFEIKKGDRVGIIGRNGAGKSTLLKILSQITSPTKGNIYIDGRIGSLLEVGTGFHQELTGRENIYLNGSILGMKRREIDKKLDEIVGFAGIEKFIDTPVKRYSSGMFVRLGFAVAAHLEPEILIVDEVLAVGDAEFQKKAIGKMEDVSNNEGRTILFVSHNMASIKKLCTNGILLNKGKIEYNGSIENTLGKYLEENRIEYKFNSDHTDNYRIRSIELLDNEKEDNNVLSCDDDIVLQIELVIKSKVDGAYGYLALYNESGEIIIESDSNDLIMNRFDELNPGVNLLRIIIPKRIIGHGRYHFYLNLTDSKGKILNNPGYCKSFTLNDLSTKRGNSRSGYLSTILNWEIEGVENV